MSMRLETEEDTCNTPELPPRKTSGSKSAKILSTIQK
jgi:hypothetical protein